MEKMRLAAGLRETQGGLTRLRGMGFVPGILYGKSRKPQMIQVENKILERVTSTGAGLNAIFELSLAGKTEGLVRIREYQADPIKRNFIHVDLQSVALTEKIEVEVPIRIVGKAEGVKLGGVLEQLRRSLHLKCLVSNIPEHIDVDVSPLMIGDNMHADDIRLPEGVEFPHETNFTILSVVPPTKEEEVKPAEAAAVEGVAAAPAEGEAAKAAEPGKEPAKGGEAPKKE